MKMSYRTQLFCLHFRHLLHRLKDCKIYHVLHWYASLVQFLKNLNLLSLIWGHLSSLQLIYRLTHLSSFRRILGSYRIILNIFRVFWVQGSAAIHIETSHLICIAFKWLVSISNATLSYNRVTCNLSSVLIISPEFAYF